MENDARQLRPRLRGDVYVMRVPEGAYIRSNLGGAMLKGAATYEWVQGVAPMLDGTKTLHELCESVPKNNRAALEKLILMLHNRGYVKDMLDDAPHTLPADVLETYAANIAFIEYFRDSPELRFERYRSGGAVLLGAGAPLSALAHSLLRSGMRDLRIVPSDESPVDRERIGDHLAASREHDREQTVSYLDAGNLTAAIQDARVVLHVTDKPMLERSWRLPRIADKAGAVFAQAVAVGDEAWIGPVIGRDDDPTLWESAWRRLIGLATDGPALVDQPDAPPSGYLNGPTVSLVANHLCFAAFRHLTGIDEGVVPTELVRFDLETLETSKHSFLPHPLARPVVPDTAERLAGLSTAGAVDDEELARRAVACLDSRTGVFGEVTERDHEQVPLFVSEVVVSDPVGLAGGPFAVHGAGDTVVESRQRAVRRAFERYAGVMMDRRRGRALHGLDLLTGDITTVDVDDVFPAGDAAASGARWDDAVTAGLVSAANADTVRAIQAATDPFPVLDLDDLPLSERAVRYRKLLATVREDVVVYDVTAPLGVPTLAVTTSSATVAHVSDLDVAAAAEKGLELALLAYQARTSGQPAYAPPPVPELPRRLRGRQRARAVSTTLESVLTALAASGRRAVAVPLDHDPEVAALCPFAVRVVIVDG